MTDIHCHILPQIDDGSDSLQTSLMMAAISADEGVKKIVATPHVTWNRGADPSRLGQIREAVNELNLTLNREGIPVQILKGAELLLLNVEPSTTNLHTFPCIEGTNMALVEFCFDETADSIVKKLSLLTAAGITPIVAHPERYECIQKSQKLPELLVTKGCLLQLNKDSITGQFGRRVKKAAHLILSKHLAGFVASDAHSSYYRTPGLYEVTDLIAEKYGEPYAKKLTTGI